MRMTVGALLSYRPRMNTTLHVHGVSDPGRQHAKNEDAWTTTRIDTAHLLVLCDGMGGMGSGDRASTLAVETIETFVRSHDLPPRSRLEAALDQADRAVRKALCTEEARPGSTAVVVYVEANQATVAWVGDSRAYWLRNDQILGRTTDHKLVQGLVDKGELTVEQARTSRFSNVLTRSIGGRLQSDAPVKIDVLPGAWALEPGDRVLLCSDGLVDLVDDSEIPDLVRDLSPRDAAQQLVDLANRRGGHDNITCIVGVWSSAEPRFAQRPFAASDTADQATEGFAPSRGVVPSQDDDEDEDDKATVLASQMHEFAGTELLPPTPPPAPRRAVEVAPPALISAPGRVRDTRGTPPVVVAVAVFIALVALGGIALWALS